VLEERQDCILGKEDEMVTPYNILKVNDAHGMDDWSRKLRVSVKNHPIIFSTTQVADSDNLGIRHNSILS